MHPTQRKIADLIEEAAKRLWLQATISWEASGPTLEGTVTAPLSGRTHNHVDGLRTQLREAIWSLGDDEDFTSMSRDLDREDELVMVFQIVANSNLEKIAESGILDVISRKFTSRFENEVKRRPKRKQSELPDPTKPAKASINAEPLRNTFQVGARVSQETLDTIQKIRSEHGKSKREVIEEAVELLNQSLSEPK